MTEDTNYLDTQQAARILGLSAKTLARYRVTGEGPVFHRFGNRIRYLVDLLNAVAAITSGGAYVTLAQLAGVTGLGWVLFRTAFGGSPWARGLETAAPCGGCRDSGGRDQRRSRPVAISARTAAVGVTLVSSGRGTRAGDRVWPTRCSRSAQAR